MVRRDRKTMKLKVLRVISEGAVQRTRIMYKANLSWKTLREILSSLKELDLVKSELSFNRGKQLRGERTVKEVYFLTEKGREVIDMSYHIDARLGVI